MQGHPAGSRGCQQDAVPALAPGLLCWTQPSPHTATWMSPCSSEIQVLQAPTAWVQHGFGEPMSSPQAGAWEGRDGHRAVQSPASAWHGCGCPSTNEPVWTQADSGVLLKLIMLQAGAVEIQHTNISVAEPLHGHHKYFVLAALGRWRAETGASRHSLVWGETCTEAGGQTVCVRKLALIS